jgi:hypothetical protein
MSPLGVATIIAFLQSATMQRADTEEGRQGLRELEWFVKSNHNGVSLGHSVTA